MNFESVVKLRFGLKKKVGLVRFLFRECQHGYNNLV